MTTPPSITVDLDHAKKLKEAGWGQYDAAFWWFVSESKLEGEENHNLDKSYIQHFPEPCIEHDTFRRGTVAAPTAEEILRRLPIDLNENGIVRFMKCGYGYAMKQGMVWYEANDKVDFQSKHHQMADSLANAAAAMWIYLKENKLLPDSK